MPTPILYNKIVVILTLPQSWSTNVLAHESGPLMPPPDYIFVPYLWFIVRVVEFLKPHWVPFMSAHVPTLGQ